MQRLTACTFLALTLSMAACGSTVQLTPGAVGAQGTSDSLGTSDNGLGLGGEQLPAGVDGVTSLPQAPGAATSGSGATGSSRGVVPGDVAGAPAAGSPASGGPGGSAVNGRGVTPTTLAIGAAIPEGAEAAGDAFGISGMGTVAEVDMWNAVIGDVNKSGGVLGRKLVLENHPVDLATFIANPEQTYAEICNDFRDDRKVFAAFGYVANPTLRSCFAKMGSPLVVYGAFTTVPEAAYTEHGGSYLYTPTSLTHERLAELFVQSLMANSFTAKWDTTNGGPGIEPPRLGLIHADTPDQNNLYAAYTRELAKHGWKFAATVTYSGSASDALASTKAAVLQFKAEGITHVFGASGFFLRDAESQRYRPRYAFLPGLGAFGAANSPAEQLKGAQTVGWAPTQDVNEPEDPGPTAGAARCEGVMQAAGLLTRGNRQDLKLMYAVCDAVYSFQAATAAGQETSVPGLRRGYESLGTSFGTALTFAAAFGPSRHYGVNSVRDMAFDSTCS